MSKYSVLLVDDEEFVFEVMMKKMNWEEMGFHVDGYARNGLEALEMAEELQPDVVMTDIKMPYMDGLTLCGRLKELYPSIKTIIFSGFDEFEYAKEAIRLEATEYILKPIDSAELEKVFLSIRKKLDIEISERRNIDNLQQYYLNSLPVLQDNFYITLLEGRMEESLIGKYSFDYQISLEGPYYVSSLIHLSYREKNGEEMKSAPFMLSLSVKQLLEEQLEDRWNTKIISHLGEIIVISQLTEENEITVFTDFMDRFCKLAKKVCKATVTAGIGCVVGEVKDIQLSYKEAKNALSHRALYGNERAINIREVEIKRKNTSYHWEGKIAADIIKAIKFGEKDKLEEKIKKFFDTVGKDDRSIQSYKLHLMKLVVELIEFMEQYELDVKEIFQDIENFPENILIESKEEARESFLEKTNSILRMLHEKRRDSSLSFITAAEDYVKENYWDQELCIESICQHLNVSSSYFSTTFKKTTGKTFINYLTDCRMDEAIRLLQTTECKTYEIAEKIGYSDPNYFSYAFKKKYGISPSKYRRQEK